MRQKEVKLTLRGLQIEAIIIPIVVIFFFFFFIDLLKYHYNTIIIKGLINGLYFIH